jgi:hypothetical protein
MPYILVLLFLIEVQAGELAVIFPCRPIVCLGRLEFIVKNAKKSALAVNLYSRPPSSIFLVPSESFIS